MEYYRLYFSEILSNFFRKVPKISHLKSDHVIYTIHRRKKVITIYVFCVKETGVTLFSPRAFPRRMVGVNPFLLYLLYYLQ